MKMEQLLKEKRNMNLKAEKYVRKWIKLLKAIKLSKKGFSERSIREDRENH